MQARTMSRFLSSDPEALEAQVSRCLAAAPAARLDGVVALVSPHAGLEYSGKVAARAWRAVEGAGFDSVVVVGAGHRRAVRGAAVFEGPYAFPGGELAFDADLCRRLLDASPLIAADAGAHQEEHSVEVQLPFAAAALGRVKGVGLLMNAEDLATVAAVGKALASAVRGGKTLLVASTDFSHFPDGETADLVDASTAEALATMDPAVFWLSNRLMLERGLAGLDTACCGAAAAAAVLAAARELGADDMRLLERTHSGRAAGDSGAAQVVGYVAAAFVRTGAAGGRPHDGKERAALLAAARESIRVYLEKGGSAEAPLSRLPRLNVPGATFVTLRDAKGGLRGCIGELEPSRTLLESVRRNAVCSAVRDSRFPPVELDELEGLRIEISILSPLRPARWQEVKPGDGVRIERGGRGGVFLPQVWEQIPDKDEFLRILCTEKAGLPPDAYKQAGAAIKVFSVEKMLEMI